MTERKIGNSPETTLVYIQSRVKEALCAFEEIPVAVAEKIGPVYQEMNNLMTRFVEMPEEPTPVMRGVRFELGSIDLIVFANGVWLHFNEEKSLTVQVGEAFLGDEKWYGKVFEYRLDCLIDEDGKRKDNINEVSLFENGSVEYRQSKEGQISNRSLGPGMIAGEVQGFLWKPNNVA